MTGFESLRCGPLSACSHFFTPGVRPADQASQLSAVTSWPYQFVKLPPEDRHTRRLLLDQYGLYAQLSALILFSLAVVFRLALQALRRMAQRRASSDAESMLPSPGITKNYLRRSRLSAKLCRLHWWLDGNVTCCGINIGQRDHLVLCVLWTGWLLFLCLHRTGNGKPQTCHYSADLSCSTHVLNGTLSYRLPPFGKTIRHYWRLPIPYPVPTGHKALQPHRVGSGHISRTHQSLAQRPRLDQLLIPCHPRSALSELLHPGWWPGSCRITSRAPARHSGTVGHDPPVRYFDSGCPTACVPRLLLHACHRGHGSSRTHLVS